MPVVTEALQNIPLFVGLPEETVNKIADVGVEKRFHKDEVIFAENGSDTSLCVILEGKVKVTKKSGEEEVILNTLSTFDFFGEMAILDGQAHSANVVAIEDTELFMLGRDAFLELLSDYKEIGLSILKELAVRLRQANIKIKALSLKDTEAKIAMILIQLAENSGRIENGHVEIAALSNYQEISQQSGTSRETASRSIQNFIKKGFIEVDGDHIIFLDYEKFKELYGK